MRDAFGFRFPLIRGLAAWLTGVALLAVMGRPLCAQQDTVLAEAAVEVRFLDGPAEVVPALVYDGTMLLPVHRLFTLAEIKVTAFALRDSLVAVLEPAGRLIHFHPDRGELRLGDSVLALAPHEALWWDGDLFAPPEIFERTIGTIITINWRTLAAEVGRTAGLPLIRRQRRELRNAQLSQPGRPMALELRPQLPTVGGAVANWAFTALTGSQTDYYLLDLGFGGRFVGGNLTLEPRFRTAAGGTSAQLRAAWERAWPTRRWVRQVRIGDVYTSGRRAQLVRGAAVTNAPFARSSEFDVEQVLGHLPPGWEVEMYGRGRLLGYGTVDAAGAYQLPLGLRYGLNPYELVMYGPTGEVIREKRTIRVPYSRLPGGHFEYAAALGQCRYGSCDAVFSADTRYGLTGRITLQGGMDLFALKEGGVLWQPYAAASAAVLPPLTITGEMVANGMVRGSANFEPWEDLRLAFAHTHPFAGAEQVDGTYAVRTQTEATGFWRPGLLDGRLFFQAAGIRVAQPEATRTITQASASAWISRMRYSAGLRYEATSYTTRVDRHLFAVDLGVDAILPWRNRWIRGANLRGQASIEPAHGLAAFTAGIGRTIERTVRADLAVGWVRSGGWGLNLALTTTLPGPRVGIRSQTGTESGTTGLIVANGSMIYDPEHRRVRWGDGADLGRAGVTGFVYVDANGNGKFDGDEAGLPKVRVQVGGRSTTTDPDGKFVVWDLLPFESVEVGVDSLSFDDPRMLPGAPLLEIRPTPNSFVPVEVPVVVGAEISGWVVMDGLALAGIPVVLRELNTGAEVTLVTFSDGTFYRAGVRPGEYEITLPDAAAEQLGVYALPMHIFVPPGTGDKRYDGIGIELGRLGG